MRHACSWAPRSATRRSTPGWHARRTSRPSLSRCGWGRSTARAVYGKPPSQHSLHRLALIHRAWTHLAEGELVNAAQLYEEERLVADATRNPPDGHSEMLLAAWLGADEQATDLIESTLREAAEGGLGYVGAWYARSVLL